MYPLAMLFDLFELADITEIHSKLIDILTLNRSSILSSTKYISPSAQDPSSQDSTPQQTSASIVVVANVPDGLIDGPVLLTLEFVHLSVELLRLLLQLALDLLGDAVDLLLQVIVVIVVPASGLSPFPAFG